MTSPTVDRRFGLVGNAALKAPVAAIATANITLSGLQTIDGVALLAVNASGVPDRVLVTGQTTASQNGIYDVNTAAWSRSSDADGPYDLARGSMVLVNGGTSNATTVWMLTTAGAITIGTTALTWQIATGATMASAVLAAQTAEAGAIAAEAAAASAEAAAAAIVLGNFMQLGTGAVSRTFASKDREVFSVDDFGAVGDGITDDSAALALASAAINAAGGGVLELRHGAVYRIGGQTLQNPPINTYYTFPPNVSYPIEFANCTKPVVLRGNGAVIRCLDNAKYGVFNNDGTPKVTAPGYLGPGASTPYFAMIYAHGCKSVRLENVELDGNLNNLSVGGYFSDTGIQLQATGFWLQNNSGPVTVHNVYTHHNGEDGYEIDGSATGVTFTKEAGVLTGVRAECNGRQGMSFVGGKGWSFIGCTYNWTGKANPGSDTLGKVSSNPSSGVDFEAEGGKEIRDLVFHNCEFIANYATGIVADSGTNTDRISFYDCTFIGTTNYAVWTNRPGFKFKRCKIVGTWVDLWDGSVPFQPQDAVMMEDCFHSNNAALSPTGTVYTVNSLIWEGGTGHVSAYRCTFENWLSPVGAMGNSPTLSIGDGPHFHGCNFISKAGSFRAAGRFYGRCWFIEDGGTLSGVPGPINGAQSIVGKTNSGPSVDSWYFRTGGVSTLYQATNDSTTDDVIGSRTTAIDADFTLTQGTDTRTQVLSGVLTAGRTITLSGGKAGSRFRIVRTGGGAFNWSVGGLKSLTAASQWCEVEHNGSAWALVANGAL